MKNKGTINYALAAMLAAVAQAQSEFAAMRAIAASKGCKWRRPPVKGAFGKQKHSMTEAKAVGSR